MAVVAAAEDPARFAALLDDFPDSAMRGVGLGDLSIIKVWEEARSRFHGRRVTSWSLDGDLEGYDSSPNG